MLISEDIKLDYSDVLIRPKRSTMNSWEELISFSGVKKKDIPIKSNMDTVEHQMHGVLGLSKHYINYKNVVMIIFVGLVV